MQNKKVAAFIEPPQKIELYPYHCTSFSVKAEIHKSIPVKEVGVGLEIVWYNGVSNYNY